MIRLAALQACPALPIRPATAALHGRGMSSVSSTMNGSEPPSSRMTFLRLRPAISATAAPARSLPVTDTPTTRGSRDDVGHLVVAGEDVAVRPAEQSGVVEDLLDRQRRFRALRRVFEDDGVADHQVGGGETGYLVVGEVPRHDAEQRADGFLAYHRRTPTARGQWGVLQELRGVLGVVAVDGRDQLDLTFRLPGGLAHLAGDQRGQRVDAFEVQLGHPDQDRSALGLRRLPPGRGTPRPNVRRPRAISASVAVGYSRSSSLVAGFTTW